jgi:hypothetical protein
MSRRDVDADADVDAEFKWLIEFYDENVDLDISNVLHDENSLQGNLNVTSNKKINSRVLIFKN